MGFSIHVWSLYALSYCSGHCKLLRCETIPLATVYIYIPEFIYTHTNSAALQERLHECSGWFTTHCTGISGSSNCHIPLHSSIIKSNTGTHIRDCLWFSTACPAVECHLQTTERKADITIHCRQSWYNVKHAPTSPTRKPTIRC